jgi:hypothetical protein
MTDTVLKRKKKGAIQGAPFDLNKHSFNYTGSFARVKRKKN